MEAGMKRIVGFASTLVLLGIAAPAYAQNEAPVQHVQLQDDNGPQQPGLITCSYNASGAYTGSDSAQPGAQPGGPYRSGDGDYTWSYNIQAPNGQSCPQTKPGG
jgi:hypothetical protein